MKMRVTRVRRGLFGLGMVWLGGLVVMDAVWAQGGVSFIARQDFEVGSGPASITVGDFNDDGYQDLATAAAALDTVPILLGRGDGTFLPAQRVGVGSVPVSIAVGDFNGDGLLDLATANAAANSVSILTSGGVVNDLVAFEPLPATFCFTPDPKGCPDGFIGTFRFAARLTNTSERSLTDLAVQVIALTQGNLLQNADGGPAGVDARLTVPRADDFTDGSLSPEEFVDVPFVICLTARQPFTVEVEVLGVVGSRDETPSGARHVGRQRIGEWTVPAR
jgi:hypothetical protein